MRNLLMITTTALAAFVALTACEPYQPYDDTQMELHPLEGHRLEPQLLSSTDEAGQQVAQIAAGRVTGVAPEQPIAFTHYRHVTVLGMDCQYCHAGARNSPYSGPPPVEMCMGCHEHVKTESPEIQKIQGYWEAGEPIPWRKVHDLPDYVYFSHKRHVRAGVDCTECHGQVPLMGQWPDGDPSRAEVMTREATLQMGWCLECHAEHPSIDENYGEAADARRAELKDCWTCHK